MIDKNDKLYRDFEAVRQISIVPTMLEVICRTTGMGFAAVARVTENRWLACSVRDEVNFGLEAGGELKIETTICNEIRDNRKPVIIDHVDMDETYCQHHTPKMYGLQSYISFPIILKNGDFFGTLCAIDSKPAMLNNPKIIGTFTMFAELLSFHLQSLDVMEKSYSNLLETNRQLTYSQDENRRYRQVSTHNLREPLRKIRLFSDKLVNRTSSADLDEAKTIALKINSFAQELTKLIQDFTEFTELDNNASAFETVDLNQILSRINARLEPALKEKNAVVAIHPLPVVSAIPAQMEQLFSHLIGYAISRSKTDSAPVIKIYSHTIAADKMEHSLVKGNTSGYCEIIVEDNRTGVEQQELEMSFDIFIHSNDDQSTERYGAGLAFCQKIVHNHGGVLKAASKPGEGTSFSIILPVAAK